MGLVWKEPLVIFKRFLPLKPSRRKYRCANGIFRYCVLHGYGCRCVIKSAGTIGRER